MGRGQAALLQPLMEQVLGNLSLSIDQCRSLEPGLKEQVFPAKQPLVRAGQHWRHLFLIERGLVRLYYLDTDGRESNKSFFSEGAVIWPVAPRDREYPVRFEIAAVEQTTVISCPVGPLQALLEGCGAWERFALPYAERLLESKFQREHDFLLMSARERLVQFEAQNPELSQRLPDYHLASFLGITNVSLSRIRNKPG
ncbi:MAG: Crp/Fnr family transcriptional regulator [Oceanospirillaceae bacterium]|nr:Crp/Fnr family transcriptional regulator [Oceanospirillaceae bacterium]